MLKKLSKFSLFLKLIFKKKNMFLQYQNWAKVSQKSFKSKKLSDLVLKKSSFPGVGFLSY